MKEDLKAWCQQHHCEALAQLAVHEGSRETLLRDGSVVPALEGVAASGLTQAARELAAAALSALSDKELVMAAEGQKHIMLSCKLTGAVVHNISPTDGGGISFASLKYEFVWLCGVCRPVGFTGHDQEGKRVADCSWLCHLVRPDEHEGIDDGRDERCDRGSRRDAVRREPGVQGVGERACCIAGHARHCSLTE